MSFEEAAGQLDLEGIYAKAQVETISDAVRTKILDFLEPEQELRLDDVEQFFLQIDIKQKRGSPVYFGLLEKLFGGLMRHTLVQGLVLEDYAKLFVSCADRMTDVIRVQRKAELISNAELKDYFSIIEIGNRQE